MAQPWNRRDRLRHIAGGAAGNLVEWYDWYMYSAFSLYFAPVFFPHGDATAQLLNTAAVFAVGFVMRPLGAWLMGRYADHSGRKAGLTLSVLLMCGGSLMIAATPGYAAIGPWAPALLLLARVLQGLSVGGEYGASATFYELRAVKYRMAVGYKFFALLLFLLLFQTVETPGNPVFACLAALYRSGCCLSRRRAPSPSIRAEPCART